MSENEKVKNSCLECTKLRSDLIGSIKQYESLMESLIKEGVKLEKEIRRLTDQLEDIES